jgi:hypothetical protein
MFGAPCAGFTSSGNAGWAFAGLALVTCGPAVFEACLDEQPPNRNEPIAATTVNFRSRIIWFLGRARTKAHRAVNFRKNVQREKRLSREATTKRLRRDAGPTRGLLGNKISHRHRSCLRLTLEGINWIVNFSRMFFLDTIGQAWLNYTIVRHLLDFSSSLARTPQPTFCCRCCCC